MMQMSRRAYLGVATPHGVQARIREGPSEEILNLRLDLADHDLSDWTDPDKGPEQLAIAILADATSNDGYARARYKLFKDEVTAQLPPGGGWRIPANAVLHWVETHPLTEDDY